MNKQIKINYCEAIRSAFIYLLDNYAEVFILGQGLWSPWYVGNTMKDFDKLYSKDRIIDTPISESACSGMSIGAAITGMKPILVHPRMDFMMYSMDSIVNQAAKWYSMFGGQRSVPLTIRAVINRGNEQGAQHSQALHSLFAHIPGLAVVMPSSVLDARDLLISSVLSPNPVLYIDDRWLYEEESTIPVKITPKDFSKLGPKILLEGKDITLVSLGYATKLSLEVAKQLQNEGISVEVIDLRILSPLKIEKILKSVKKTGRLLVVDIGNKSFGASSEIITNVVEKIDPKIFKSKPERIALPDSPAPSSFFLEKNYYFVENDIKERIVNSIYK